MPNQDQVNQENTSFNNGADSDQNLNRALQKGLGGKQGQDLLSKGVSSDTEENKGQIEDTHMMDDAEAQVRETEDASLQDSSYAFDESNTENEEYHDADDEMGMEDFDFDNDDDFVQ